MTANDSKYYLSYLNGLVYQHTDHHSINKKAIDADYSALAEKIETNLRATKNSATKKIKTCCRH